MQRFAIMMEALHILALHHRLHEIGMVAEAITEQYAQDTFKPMSRLILEWVDE